MNPGEQRFPRQKKETKTFEFKGLLQSTGWICPAYVAVSDGGEVLHISTEPLPDTLRLERVNGYALPGFQNAHSHAFQYAMAGMAEKHKAETVDDFWTWRQAMYGCALTIDPDQMQSIATMVYVEMLKRGYTHVAEFQYLHHDKDGKPYASLSEMSVSLLAAAAIAGIKTTIIPVYYQKAGFGKEAESWQRRFIFKDIEQYFTLLEDCTSVVRNLTTARVGFGVHSLRAADANDVQRLVSDGPRELPFHLHAAEQLKEVNDCLAFLKQRPVEWLLNNVDLNERFHLVHCTHLDNKEVIRLSESNAHVILCPGTEANLGDGIFRLTDFARRSSRWSIGTDSQISLNPLEDLRWLDYVQRLTTHKRNTFADGASTLITNTLVSGRRAMGITTKNFFDVGQPFDAVVYDGDSPLLNSTGNEHLLPTILYTADSSSVIGTLVNGDWLVKDHEHRNETEIVSGFYQTLKKISQQI